jgi:hypothetical protein
LELESIIQHVNIKTAIISGVLTTDQIVPFINILSKSQILDLIKFGKMSESLIGKNVSLFDSLDLIKPLLEYNQFSTKFLEKHMVRRRKCNLPDGGTFVTYAGDFRWEDISHYQIADTKFWTKQLQKLISYDFLRYWCGWHKLPQEQLDDLVSSLLKTCFAKSMFSIVEMFSYWRISPKVIEENLWIFDVKDKQGKYEGKTVRDYIFNKSGDKYRYLSKQIVEAIASKPEEIAPLSYIKEKMYEVNYNNSEEVRKYKRKLWSNLSEKMRKLIWKDSDRSVDLDTATYCYEYFAKPPETIETRDGDIIPDSLIDFFVSKFGGAALADKEWFQDWIDRKPIKAFG